jgi:hypothetical protein
VKKLSDGHNGNYVTMEHEGVMFDLPWYDQLERLSGMTVAQLKERCKLSKVSGYSKLTREGIAKLLADYYLKDGYEHAKTYGYACGGRHGIYGARSCPRCGA